ncbi:MAG: alpha/beta hydrolase [Verrucomicrobiota bacterium]
MKRRFAMAAALGVIMTFSACTTLTPFEEIAGGVAKDHLVDVKGQRVFVKQTGSGPPLVLLHGFAASSYTFRKLQPLLDDRFETIAIDWNGFGYTERPPDREAYTDEGQVILIEETLEALDIDSCVIVGHSYGGHLGLKLAEKRPELVEKLVLISPALKFPKPPWHLRLAPMRWAGYPAVRLLLSSPERFRSAYLASYHDPDDFPIEVSEEYRKRLLVEGLGNAYFAMSRNIQRGLAVPADLQQIDQPVFVIAGEMDGIVPLKSIENAIQGYPSITLTRLEDVGHSSPEEIPEAVAGLIHEFVEGDR